MNRYHNPTQKMLDLISDYNSGMLYEDLCTKHNIKTNTLQTYIYAFRLNRDRIRSHVQINKTIRNNNIRGDRNLGFSYKNLCKKYNSSLSSINHILHKDPYKDSVKESFVNICKHCNNSFMDTSIFSYRHKYCSKKCHSISISLRNTKLANNELDSFKKDYPVLSIKELCQKYNISEYTVYNYKKRYNLLK